MKFTGSGSSGFPVRMDGETASEVERSGVRPMEMIALGLIGCQGMDVLSVLQKKRQDVTRFEVQIRWSALTGLSQSVYPRSRHICGHRQACG